MPKKRLTQKEITDMIEKQRSEMEKIATRIRTDLNTFEFRASCLNNLIKHLTS